MRHSLVRDRLTWLTYGQLAVYGYFIYGFGPVVPLLRDEQQTSRAVASLHGTALAVGAVLGAVERIIRECARLGITSSICGQAPSVHPDYVDRLVEWGIDSVSVTPDVAEATRRNIAAAERRVLLRRARGA